jgi:hypothetical protein
VIGALLWVRFLILAALLTLTAALLWSAATGRE